MINIFWREKVWGWWSYEGLGKGNGFCGRGCFLGLGIQQSWEQSLF